MGSSLLTPSWFHVKGSSSSVMSVTRGDRIHRKLVSCVCITVCGVLLVEEWALIRGNQPAGQHFSLSRVFRVCGTGPCGFEVSWAKIPRFWVQSFVVPDRGGGGGFGSHIILLFPDTGTRVQALLRIVAETSWQLSAFPTGEPLFKSLEKIQV